jgi:hemoglobin
MSALLIIIILIAIIVVAFIATSRMATRASVDPESLYNRLGGVYNIAKVVDHFSDALIDKRVGESSNPELADWNREKSDMRLPGLKWMRTLWVCDITGGPYKFRASTKALEMPADHMNLERAHCPFKISSAEFDGVAAQLKESLEVHGVPEKEVDEVLAAFAAHKHEINACPRPE